MEAKVLFLLAHPFSGSTLLTYMLGEHPAVMPVGELFWRHCRARSQEEDPVCYRERIGTAPAYGRDGTLCIRCKDSCRTWAKLEEPVPTAKLYSTIAEVFGQACLIDSSKGLWWYEHLHTVSENVEFSGLFLSKPVWGWIGSKARYSSFFKCEGTTKQMLWHEIPDATIERWADAWCEYIEGYHTLVVKRGIPWVSLKYEDLCTSYVTACRNIWSFLHLPLATTITPTCRASAWAQQHQLHGNTGTNARITEALKGGEDATVPIVTDEMVFVDRLPDMRFYEIPMAMDRVQEAMRMTLRSW